MMKTTVEIGKRKGGSPLKLEQSLTFLSDLIWQTPIRSHISNKSVCLIDNKENIDQSSDKAGWVCGGEASRISKPEGKQEKRRVMTRSSIPFWLKLGHGLWYGKSSQPEPILCVSRGG